MNDEKRPPIIELEEESTVKLTLEQRFGILHNIFKHQYFAVYIAIADRLGWQVANEISSAVADEATPMLAAAYQRKFNLGGEGAAAVSQVLQAEFQGEGSEARVVEETTERAAIEVNCTFGHALQSERFKDVPITNGLCEQGCRQWLKDIAATVDPDLDAERDTWMGDGAPRCNYRIFHKGTEPWTTVPTAAEDPRIPKQGDDDGSKRGTDLRRGTDPEGERQVQRVVAHD
jgi:predicted ArsR family transcriptional regulator